MHTCFRSCRDYDSTELEDSYTFDSRPTCDSLKAQDPNYERYLLCLYDDDKCENTILADEQVIGLMPVSVFTALIAILISNPL